MRKLSPQTKKLFITFLTLLFIVLCMTGISVAIYTSQVYQRSVVRNRNTDVVRFGSDKLITVAKNTPATEVYYPVTNDSNSMSFKVCNYNQEKSTLVNESDIGYKIVFSFENIDADYNYVITCNGVNIDNESIHTLKGGVVSADNYVITFSDKDYQRLKVTVTVTPDDFTLTRNNILIATLIPISYGTVQQFHVMMEFPDSLRKKTDGASFDLSDLDAYNVLVSVAGGEGDIYIRWNSDMVEMDYYFLKNYDVTDIGNGELQVVLHMNSADETSSCLIPFYNTGSQDSELKSWNDLKNCIAVGVYNGQ